MTEHPGSTTTPHTARTILAFMATTEQLELACAQLLDDPLITAVGASSKPSAILTITKSPRVMWHVIQPTIEKVLSSIMDGPLNISIVASGYTGGVAFFVTKSHAQRHTLTISIEGGVYEELLLLCEEQGITITDLVRRGVVLHKFLWEHRDKKLNELLRLLGM